MLAVLIRSPIAFHFSFWYIYGFATHLFFVFLAHYLSAYVCVLFPLFRSLHELNIQANLCCDLLLTTIMNSVNVVSVFRDHRFLSFTYTGSTMFFLSLFLPYSTFMVLCGIVFSLCKDSVSFHFERLFSHSLNRNSFWCKFISLAWSVSPTQHSTTTSPVRIICTSNFFPCFRIKLTHIYRSFFSSFAQFFFFSSIILDRV